MEESGGGGTLFLIFIVAVFIAAYWQYVLIGAIAIFLVLLLILNIRRSKQLPSVQNRLIAYTEECEHDWVEARDYWLESPYLTCPKCGRLETL
jgi:hypothetical protein